MDKIYLEHLEFYAYHGVFEEEKEKGQTFYVSVVMDVDLNEAAVNDDLEKTVHYGIAYDIIADVTLNNKFDLIERLADEIINRLFAEFPIIEAISVRVDKPKAPGTTCFFPAAIELRRERK